MLRSRQRWGTDISLQGRFWRVALVFAFEMQTSPRTKKFGDVAAVARGAVG
jgi:hypothetical protein